MRHRRLRPDELDELMVLVSRTSRVVDALTNQPRLLVALTHDGGLMLVPTNEAGSVAVSLIQQWAGSTNPVHVRAGDSVTLHADIYRLQSRYPIPHDGDKRETSSDRRDTERAGPATGDEGVREEKWVSPSEWFANYFKERPPI